jgi:Cu-processing system ATP-binding protein
MSSLRIQNVTKKFGNYQALKDCSFSFESGKIHGVLGPNGCGKSTLMKCILGLQHLNSGTMFWGSENLQKNEVLRERIGYIPQVPSFPSNLEVHEILEMLQDLQGRKAVDADHFCQLFGLNDFQGKSFKDLSGGMKQRVSVVAAMMFRPQLLLCDEPTVGLDPYYAVQFKKALKSFVEKESMAILVTHILSEVHEMVDDFIFLQEGRMIFQGSPGDLILQSQQENFEDALLAMIYRQTEKPQESKLEVFRG